MENKIGAQIQTALWFHRHGFSVIPQFIRTKTPKFRWAKYQTQQPTENELRRWFSIPSNGAIVCGANNLMVIDFDDASMFTEWVMWASKDHKIAYIINNAYKVRTARGVHVYVRSASKPRNLHYPGIDIKGFGGLVTIPGSIHPSGFVYTEYGGSEFPIVSDISEVLPSWMMVTPEPQKSLRKTVDQLSAADILNMDTDNTFVDLELIKRNYRIENMLQGVIIDSGSHWGLTRCPFHDDNSPSFWVDTAKQLCGCFSGCTSAPLDAINLYARLHGLSNTEAIKEMGK